MTIKNLSVFSISILMLTMLLVSCHSGPVVSKIKTDPALAKEVDSLILNNPGFLGDLGDGEYSPRVLTGVEYLLHVQKTYDYTQFIRQEATDLNALLGMQELSGEHYLVGWCDGFLRGDTLVMGGGLGHSGGAFFETKIFGDQSTTTVFLASVQKIYTTTKDKDKKIKEISLRAIVNEITLSASPRFRSGATMKGKAHIKTEPFYQKDRAGNLQKITAEFEIVFNCLVK